MRGIIIAYNGEGYMLRNRRRLKDLSTIMPAIKAIFNILYFKNMLAKDVRKFYSSKLALPVILLIVGRIDNHVQGTRPNADSAFAEYILCAHTRTKWNNLSPTTQLAYHVLTTCRATRYGWTDTDQFTYSD